MLGVFYLCGLFNGFSINYNVFYKSYISKLHILAIFLVVLITELIRYCLWLNLNNNKKNKMNILAKVIMIINYVLIDYIIIGEGCDFTSRYEIINLLLTFFIPSLTKNLFLDYTVQKYGYASNLWYRLIMDLYVYFIPVIPDVNIFIKTMVLSVFPYFLYVSLENIYGKDTKKIQNIKKKNIFVSVITLILFVVLVYLISCQFTYSMIAIGSESMQKTINKGDAVVYKAYKDEKLSEGEIIVFRQGNRIIVHRIASVIENEDGEQAYITKGDANLNEDNWIVTKKNILGIVKFRILLIAWPSVLLNEWL